MSVAFISHPNCLLHNMGTTHPEQPARLQVIEDELIRCGLSEHLNYYQAPLATKDQLQLVHDPDYIEFIFNISPQKGLIPLDPDVWMNPHSLIAALHAAGAAVYGVDLVMKGDTKAAFCNVRPPGHHAERNKAMGFCFFNNVAVATAYALDFYKLQRIAIVDFDVHHGNGTENIFQAEPRVLYCSSFEHPFYPFSGAETRNQHILNIPLAAGTTGEQFRAKVTEHWLEQIQSFAPSLIFFSAGFDAYIDDDMADLRLTPNDYLWITQKIKTIAERCCQGRMVSVLEGGYALNGLGVCAAAHIRGLLEPVELATI
ncbi:histone deacetylase family protein [Legionella sp. 29fVS95]|uniref:histone deacetylase family protein n=1 Tax=Legionella sp. 29fVS95 TaxID=3402813 RepID=UPI003AF9B15F